MKDPICPKCKHPKTSGSDGRLTQWMLSCRCDVHGPEDVPLVPVTLCRTCGKRVGEGRAGSFTQFIFRFDICSCEVPNPIVEMQHIDVSARGKGPADGIGTTDEEDTGDPEDSTGEPSLFVEHFPVDRYKPLASLGTGGSGTVYLSKDLLLKKRVAVKILRTLTASQLINFQQEARTTSRLKHRNIVELHDFAVSPDGTPYMVLEYVDGISLKELLEQQGPLPCDLAILLFKQVCDALTYAHQNQIFHRDVKPSNILLCEDESGRPLIRLIDFGLAQIVKEEGSGKEQAPTLAGTPVYMSPDQGLNREYTERSEIYSIGCVMFEALSGAPPFQGANALETLALHAEAKPPSLVQAIRAPDSSPFSITFTAALDEMMAKCLAKKPEDRFQTTQELKSALENLESLASLEEQEDLYGSSNGSEVEQKEAGPTFFSKEQLSSNMPLVIGVCTMFLVCTIVIVGAVAPYVLKVTKPLSKQGVQDAGFKDMTISKLVDPSSTVVSLNASLDREELKDLSLYKNVLDLDLANNHFNDEDVAYIKSPRLKILNLSNTSVKSLKYVAKLEMVEQLILAGTEIDKQSIERLAEMPNLKLLDIRGTLIDDSAIDSLCRLQLLNTLITADSKLTDKGLREIHNRLPGCLINDHKALIPRLYPSELLSLILANNFSDAQREARRAISVIEKVQGKDSTALASYYVVLAQAQMNSGKTADAKANLEKAITLARRWRNARALKDATLTRITIAENEKNIKDSYSYGVEYCDVANQFERPNFQLIEYMFQTAERAIQLNKLISARKLLGDLLDTSAEVLKQTPPPPDRIHIYIAWSYQRLARFADKQPREAEKWMRKAIHEFENNLNSHPSCKIDLAFAYAWTATLCGINGKFDEAIKFQQKAVDSYNKLHLEGVNEQESRLEMYKNQRNGAVL